MRISGHVNTLLCCWFGSKTAPVAALEPFNPFAVNGGQAPVFRIELAKTFEGGRSFYQPFCQQKLVSWTLPLPANSLVAFFFPTELLQPLKLYGVLSDKQLAAALERAAR